MRILLPQRPELMPPEHLGLAQGPLAWEEIDWVRELGKDVYFALFLRLPGVINLELPKGYRLYVLGFHLEPLEPGWLEKQLNDLDAPVIVLNDCEYYDFPLPKNARVYTYYGWQHQIDQIIEWFPQRQSRNVTHKVSCLCNRITQSKLIVFTALLEYLGEKECLVKLSEWLEEKNVHHREPSGNKILDNLSSKFYQNYLGKTYKVDDFNNTLHNYQRVNSNPWNPFYLNVALHFTNESYHYSLMSSASENIIRPGPYLSEKTLKCLVAGVPFIPVGQFRTYANLRKLGLEFDYGLDLSWDNDPGNLTRLEKIVHMIRELANYTKEDIMEMTRSSTEHNTDMIWSGEFQRLSRLHNETVRDQILKEYSR